MKKKLLVLLMLFVLVQLTAQWSDDTSVNLLICNEAGEQQMSVDYGSRYNKYSSIATEDNGFIVAWHDERNTATTGYDIYAQKYDEFGFEQWTSGGLAVCIATEDQKFPVIAPDGNSGAIFSWFIDDRNTATTGKDIYAQRISSDGTVEWTSNGVAICTASNTQDYTVIQADGNGGAILAWMDNRLTDYDIYAQHINSSGVIQWTSDGIDICSETGNQLYPQIASNENGGAVLCWLDSRGTGALVYMQRINFDGSTSWIADGVCLDAVGGESYVRPSVVSDGSGGGIAVWHLDGHGGSGYDYDIAAHGVDSDGTPKWSDVAVEVATNGDQSYPAAISDGNGGIIVTWYDDRLGGGFSDDHVYVQRIDNNGVAQWGSSGMQICNVTSSEQEFPSITSDGDGGAIVAWTDKRNDSTSSRDIYAQKIDNDGNFEWDAEGIPVSTASDIQSSVGLVQNGNGNVFLAWHHKPNTDDDLYCQLISAEGSLPITSQTSVTSATSCSFSGTQVEMDFSALSGSGNVSILELPACPTGMQSAHSAEIYWHIEEENTITNFTTSITFSYDGYLGSLSESGLMIYRDDGSGWNQWTDYTLDTINNTITANGVTAFSDWGLGDEESTLPVELSSFTAIQTTENFAEINWTTQSEVNLFGYNIYRNEDENIGNSFLLNSNIIEATNGTSTENYSYIDEEIELSQTYFYWLESVDLDGSCEFFGPINITISKPNNDEESPEIVFNTGINSIYPNPFNPSTTISYYLEHQSRVKLEIFNAKGQKVFNSDEGEKSGKQMHYIIWNGENNLSGSSKSGIYFVRLQTGSFVENQKIILLK